MSDWMRLEDDLRDHKKTVLLSARTKAGRPLVVGHLVCLWLFALKYAWEDGDMSAWGEDGIEKEAGWEGQKGLFFKAANEVGFLDGMKVHNWYKYQAEYIQRKIRRNNARTKAGQKPDKSRTKAGQKSDNRCVALRSVA